MPPPHALLDPLQEREQGGGLEGGDSTHRHVEEARLVGDVRRLRLVDGRHARHLDLAAQPLDALDQVGLTVPEVGPQPEVDGVSARHASRLDPPSGGRGDANAAAGPCGDRR